MFLKAKRQREKKGDKQDDPGRDIQEFLRELSAKSKIPFADEDPESSASDVYFPVGRRSVFDFTDGSAFYRSPMSLEVTEVVATLATLSHNTVLAVNPKQKDKFDVRILPSIQCFVFRSSELLKPSDVEEDNASSAVVVPAPAAVSIADALLAAIANVNNSPAATTTAAGGAAEESITNIPTRRKTRGGASTSTSFVVPKPRPDAEGVDNVDDEEEEEKRKRNAPKWFVAVNISYGGVRVKVEGVTLPSIEGGVAGSTIAATGTIGTNSNKANNDAATDTTATATARGGNPRLVAPSNAPAPAPVAAKAVGTSVVSFAPPSNTVDHNIRTNNNNATASASATVTAAAAADAAAGGTFSGSSDAGPNTTTTTTVAATTKSAAACIVSDEGIPIHSELGASMIDTIDNNRRLTDRNISRWSLQLLRTLNYAHTQFICVGDIEAEDVFLVSDFSVINTVKEAIKRRKAIDQAALDRQAQSVSDAAKKARRALHQNGAAGGISGSAGLASRGGRRGGAGGGGQGGAGGSGSGSFIVPAAKKTSFLKQSFTMALGGLKKKGATDEDRLAAIRTLNSEQQDDDGNDHDDDRLAAAQHNDVSHGKGGGRVVGTISSNDHTANKGNNNNNKETKKLTLKTTASSSNAKNENKKKKKVVGFASGEEAEEDADGAAAAAAAGGAATAAAAGKSEASSSRATSRGGGGSRPGSRLGDEQEYRRRQSGRLSSADKQQSPNTTKKNAAKSDNSEGEEEGGCWSDVSTSADERGGGGGEQKKREKRVKKLSKRQRQEIKKKREEEKRARELAEIKAIEIRHDELERDAWISPHRWLNAAAITAHDYELARLGYFHNNSSSGSSGRDISGKGTATAAATAAGSGSGSARSRSVSPNKDRILTAVISSPDRDSNADRGDDDKNSEKTSKKMARGKMRRTVASTTTNTTVGSGTSTTAAATTTTTATATADTKQRRSTSPPRRPSRVPALSLSLQTDDDTSNILEEDGGNHTVTTATAIITKRPKTATTSTSSSAVSDGFTAIAAAAAMTTSAVMGVKVSAEVKNQVMNAAGNLAAFPLTVTCKDSLRLATLGLGFISPFGRPREALTLDMFEPAAPAQGAKGGSSRATSASRGAAAASGGGGGGGESISSSSRKLVKSSSSVSTSIDIRDHQHPSSSSTVVPKSLSSIGRTVSITLKREMSVGGPPSLNSSLSTRQLIDTDTKSGGRQQGAGGDSSKTSSTIPLSKLPTAVFGGTDANKQVSLVVGVGGGGGGERSVSNSSKGLPLHHQSIGGVAGQHAAASQQTVADTLLAGSQTIADTLLAGSQTIADTLLAGSQTIADTLLAGSQTIADTLLAGSLPIDVRKQPSVPSNRPVVFFQLPTFDPTRSGSGTCMGMPKALEFTGAALQFALFNHRVHADLRALGLLITSLLMHRRLTPKEKLLLQDPYCDFELISSSNGAPLYTIVSRCSLEMRALLKLCFSPLQPVNVVVQANKTTVILRCNQLVAAGQIVEALKLRVSILEEGLNWVRPVYWTDTDEERRVRNIELRRSQLESMLLEGQVNVGKRLLREKRKLWFDLQPLHIQKRILKRREYRKVTDANRRYRAYHIHEAAFHWWDRTEECAWVEEAITSSLLKARHLRKISVKKPSTATAAATATGTGTTATAATATSTGGSTTAAANTATSKPASATPAHTTANSNNSNSNNLSIDPPTGTGTGTGTIVLTVYQEHLLKVTIDAVEPHVFNIMSAYGGSYGSDDELSVGSSVMADHHHHYQGNGSSSKHSAAPAVPVLGGLLGPVVHSKSRRRRDKSSSSASPSKSRGRSPCGGRDRGRDRGSGRGRDRGSGRGVADDSVTSRTSSASPSGHRAKSPTSSSSSYSMLPYNKTTAADDKRNPLNVAKASIIASLEKFKISGRDGDPFLETLDEFRPKRGRTVEVTAITSSRSSGQSRGRSPQGQGSSSSTSGFQRPESPSNKTDKPAHAPVGVSQGGRNISRGGGDNKGVLLSSSSSMSSGSQLPRLIGSPTTPPSALPSSKLLSPPAATAQHQQQQQQQGGYSRVAKGSNNKGSIANTLQQARATGTGTSPSIGGDGKPIGDNGKDLQRSNKKLLKEQSASSLAAAVAVLAGGGTAGAAATAATPAVAGRRVVQHHGVGGGNSNDSNSVGGDSIGSGSLSLSSQVNEAERARLKAALQRQRAKEDRAAGAGAGGGGDGGRSSSNKHSNMTQEQRLWMKMEKSKKRSEDRFYRDAYTALGTGIANHLSIRCNNIDIRKTVVKAKKDADNRLSKLPVILMLPHDQLILKKLAVEAETLSVLLKPLRDAIKVVGNDLRQLDHKFLDRFCVMACVGMIERFDAEHAAREVGERLAAEKIVGLFRGAKVRRIMRRVRWETNKRMEKYLAEEKEKKRKEDEDAITMGGMFESEVPVTPKADAATAVGPDGQRVKPSSRYITSEVLARAAVLYSNSGGGTDTKKAAGSSSNTIIQAPPIEVVSIAPAVHGIDLTFASVFRSIISTFVHVDDMLKAAEARRIAAEGVSGKYIARQLKPPPPSSPAATAVVAAPLVPFKPLVVPSNRNNNNSSNNNSSNNSNSPLRSSSLSVSHLRSGSISGTTALTTTTTVTTGTATNNNHNNNQSSPLRASIAASVAGEKRAPSPSPLLGLNDYRTTTTTAAASAAASAAAVGAHNKRSSISDPSGTMTRNTSTAASAIVSSMSMVEEEQRRRTRMSLLGNVAVATAIMQHREHIACKAYLVKEPLVVPDKFGPAIPVTIRVTRDDGKPSVPEDDEYAGHLLIFVYDKRERLVIEKELSAYTAYRVVSKDRGTLDDGLGEKALKDGQIRFVNSSVSEQQSAAAGGGGAGDDDKMNHHNDSSSRANSPSSASRHTNSKLKHAKSGGNLTIGTSAGATASGATAATTSGASSGTTRRRGSTPADAIAEALKLETEARRQALHIQQTYLPMPLPVTVNYAGFQLLDTSLGESKHMQKRDFKPGSAMEIVREAERAAEANKIDPKTIILDQGARSPREAKRARAAAAAAIADAEGKRKEVESANTIGGKPVSSKIAALYAELVRTNSFLPFVSIDARSMVNKTIATHLGAPCKEHYKVSVRGLDRYSFSRYLVRVLCTDSFVTTISATIQRVIDKDSLSYRVPRIMSIPISNNAVAVTAAAEPPHTSAHTTMVGANSLSSSLKSLKQEKHANAPATSTTATTSSRTALVLTLPCVPDKPLAMVADVIFASTIADPKKEDQLNDDIKTAAKISYHTAAAGAAISHSSKKNGAVVADEDKEEDDEDVSALVDSLRDSSLRLRSRPESPAASIAGVGKKQGDNNNNNNNSDDHYGLFTGLSSGRRSSPGPRGRRSLAGVHENRLSPGSLSPGSRRRSPAAVVGDRILSPGSMSPGSRQRSPAAVVGRILTPGSVSPPRASSPLFRQHRIYDTATTPITSSGISEATATVATTDTAAVSAAAAAVSGSSGAGVSSSSADGQPAVQEHNKHDQQVLEEVVGGDAVVVGKNGDSSVTLRMIKSDKTGDDKPSRMASHAAADNQQQEYHNEHGYDPQQSEQICATTAASSSEVDSQTQSLQQEQQQQAQQEEVQLPQLPQQTPTKGVLSSSLLVSSLTASLPFSFSRAFATAASSLVAGGTKIGGHIAEQVSSSIRRGGGGGGTEATPNKPTSLPPLQSDVTASTAGEDTDKGDSPAASPQRLKTGKNTPMTTPSRKTSAAMDHHHATVHAAAAETVQVLGTPADNALLQSGAADFTRMINAARSLVATRSSRRRRLVEKLHVSVGRSQGTVPEACAVLGLRWDQPHSNGSKILGYTLQRRIVYTDIVVKLVTVPDDAPPASSVTTSSMTAAATTATTKTSPTATDVAVNQGAGDIREYGNTAVSGAEKKQRSPPHGPVSSSSSLSQQPRPPAVKYTEVLQVNNMDELRAKMQEIEGELLLLHGHNNYSNTNSRAATATTTATTAVSRPDSQQDHHHGGSAAAANAAAVSRQSGRRSAVEMLRGEVRSSSSSGGAAAAGGLLSTPPQQRANTAGGGTSTVSREGAATTSSTTSAAADHNNISAPASRASSAAPVVRSAGGGGGGNSRAATAATSSATMNRWHTIDETAISKNNGTEAQLKQMRRQQKEKTEKEVKDAARMHSNTYFPDPTSQSKHIDTNVSFGFGFPLDNNSEFVKYAQGGGRMSPSISSGRLASPIKRDRRTIGSIVPLSPAAPHSYSPSTSKINSSRSRIATDTAREESSSFIDLFSGRNNTNDGHDHTTTVGGINSKNSNDSSTCTSANSSPLVSPHRPHTPAAVVGAPAADGNGDGGKVSRPLTEPEPARASYTDVIRMPADLDIDIVLRKLRSLMQRWLFHRSSSSTRGDSRQQLQLQQYYDMTTTTSSTSMSHLFAGAAEELEFHDDGRHHEYHDSRSRLTNRSTRSATPATTAVATTTAAATVTTDSASLDINHDRLQEGSSSSTTMTMRGSSSRRLARTAATAAARTGTTGRNSTSNHSSRTTTIPIIITVTVNAEYRVGARNAVGFSGYSDILLTKTLGTVTLSLLPPSSADSHPQEGRGGGMMLGSMITHPTTPTLAAVADDKNSGNSSSSHSLLLPVVGERSQVALVRSVLRKKRKDLSSTRAAAATSTVANDDYDDDYDDETEVGGGGGRPVASNSTASNYTSSYQHQDHYNAVVTAASLGLSRLSKLKEMEMQLQQEAKWVPSQKAMDRFATMKDLFEETANTATSSTIAGAGATTADSATTTTATAAGRDCGDHGNDDYSHDHSNHDDGQRGHINDNNSLDGASFAAVGEDDSEGNKKDNDHVDGHGLKFFNNPKLLSIHLIDQGASLHHNHNSNSAATATSTDSIEVVSVAPDEGSIQNLIRNNQLALLRDPLRVAEMICVGPEGIERRRARLQADLKKRWGSDSRPTRDDGKINNVIVPATARFESDGDDGDFSLDGSITGYHGLSFTDEEEQHNEEQEEGGEDGLEDEHHSTTNRKHVVTPAAVGSKSKASLDLLLLMEDRYRGRSQLLLDVHSGDEEEEEGGAGGEQQGWAGQGKQRGAAAEAVEAALDDDSTNIDDNDSNVVVDIDASQHAPDDDDATNDDGNVTNDDDADDDDSTAVDSGNNDGTVDMTAIGDDLEWWLLKLSKACPL